jgi:hypothetical protein
MLKGSKNARLPRMVIKRIVVLNVEPENMFLSHVNADYVHLVGQRQLTIGQIKYIIFL